MWESSKGTKNPKHLGVWTTGSKWKLKITVFLGIYENSGRPGEQLFIQSNIKFFFYCTRTSFLNE